MSKKKGKINAKQEQEISKRTRVGATPKPHNTYINDVVEEVRRAAA